MDGKIHTMPETALDLKLHKAEVYTRFESGNWRLNQAIDILLDYIMQHEERSQGDTQNSEEVNGLAF